MNTDILVDHWRAERRHFCSFGISEVAIAIAAEAAVAEAAVAGAITGVAGTLGASAALATGIGTLGAGALTGAALGAGEAAITGGDPGTGALGGAITGGALAGLGGAGGLIDNATGFGAVGSDALVGAGAGAVGSAVTGGNPLSGAIKGGVSGAATGALSDTGGGVNNGTGASVTQGGSTGLGGGTSAAAASAPGDINIPYLGNPSGGVPTGAIGDVGGGVSGVAGAGGGSLSSAATGGTDIGGSVSGISSPTGGGAPAGGPDNFGGDAVPAQAALGKPLELSGTPAPTVDASDSLTNSLTNAPSGGAPGTSIARGSSGLPGSGYNGDAAVDYSGNASGAGGAAAPAGNSIVNAINDPSLANVGTALSKNAGLLIPAAGLGYEALTQPSTGLSDTALTAAEQTQAQQLGLQGQGLVDTLNTGQLPAPLQSAISTATQSAKAAVRSQYARDGLSGSSMEQQALQQIDVQATQQTFQQIQQLVQTGLSETQISNQIYSRLLQQQVQSDQSLQTAINGFIGSVAGGAVKSAASG